MKLNIIPYILKHIKKIILTITILVLLSLILYFSWINFNLGFNKEYLLKNDIQKYSDLIEVGLTDQAYHEFLTPDSKAKITYRHEDIPFTQEEIEQERIRKDNCPKLPGTSFKDFRCYSNSPKHKQKQVEIPALETFSKYAVIRKNDWRNIQINKIIFPSKNRADVLLKYYDKSKDKVIDSLETWYFQNGEWLRDF